MHLLEELAIRGGGVYRVYGGGAAPIKDYQMYQDEYEQEYLLNQVRSQSSLDDTTRGEQLEHTRAALNTLHRNSSFRTIMTCSNSMIGSTCLVFPFIFQQSGILTALLTMAFVGLVSCKTCQLLFKHILLSEVDINESIRRILGPRWHVSYVVLSTSFMFLGCVIYYQLGATILYNLLQWLSHQGVLPALPAPGDMRYDRFSYQYTGLIYAFLYFLVLLKDDLKVLIKVSALGIVAILVFIVYLVYLAAQNLSLLSSPLAPPVKLLSPDILTTLGVFSLSYFVHSFAVPIFRNSASPEHINRDLRLSFLLSSLIYSLMGIFGAVAITGLPSPVDNPQTILDYFLDYSATALVLLLMLFQLLISTPLLWYCTKSLFFSSLYNNKIPPHKALYVLANTFYILVAGTLQQFNTDISTIISLCKLLYASAIFALYIYIYQYIFINILFLPTYLNVLNIYYPNFINYIKAGAICGWWLIYVIPVALHMKCLYGHGQRLLSENNALSDNLFHSLSPSRAPRKAQCSSMHASQMGSYSKTTRQLFYYSLVAIGLVIAMCKVGETLGVIGEL